MPNDDWARNILDALTKLANSPSIAWEQVSTYSALPAATTCAGSTWLVLQGSGIWPASRPSGWYYSDGASWSYLGAYNPVVTGGNVVVSNFPAIQPVSFGGSVTVGNFPASQPVTGIFWQSIQPISGAVTVSNLPATQPVSGSVNVSNFPVSQAVTGTFWQATQPISVSALPLPSGASTEATLALIKAKTDNLDVLLSTRTKPADTQTVSGAVSVSNFPVTQPVSGTFWQATQPVSGPLTDTQLRATPVPITGTLALSGSVAVNNFPLTQPVTGPLTNTELRLVPVPVSGTFFQATQPVSGTFWQSTQPVSGTFWQATQPISAVSLPLPSGAATEVTLAAAKTDLDKFTFTATRLLVDGSGVTQPVSGTFWPATQPVSGPLTDTQLRASAVPVSGTFFQATQPVSVVSLPLPTGASTEATLSAAKTDLDKLTFTATRLLVDGSGVTQPVSAPALTKGTQGANGLSVQSLKDAGRTYVSFTANAVAGVIAEALLTFAQNKQGVNTAGVTSYVITSGKTLRITSISISVKSGAAAIAFAKIILRHNTAGATTTASPIAYLCPEINTNSAVLGTGASITIPLFDGLEFFGNGTQTIGVSHLDQATTNILNVTVHGFEY